MKFLHAADIHLDSPLTGLGAAAECPVERLRQSTRLAFINLIDYAIAEAVDFIVIAGDLYDGSWRDYSTGLFFVRQMSRLADAGIPVYVALGNHDAQSRLTRELRLPDNVHVFASDRSETVFFREGTVALHGRSFAQPAVTDNLVLDYPQAQPACLNIGVLHTAVGGREAHANYAPCALTDLLAKGYDYWALGHVHAREVLHEDPHIVFPGNLQGRYIRETGAKGFTLVRVEDGRIVAAEPVAADVVRWQRCRVDLSTAVDFEDALDIITGAIATGLDDAEDRFAVVRLVLEGATPAHTALVMQRDRLVTECHGAALQASSDLWIEKVELATRPHVDFDAAAARPDAIGALIRAAAALAVDDDARAALAQDLDALVSCLPDELRTTWTQSDNGVRQIASDRLDDVIAEACSLLSARMLDAERSG